MRLWLVIALLGCGTNAVPSDPVVTTIAAPDGWRAVGETPRTFIDPENALRVVITASDAMDAKSAIAHAWMHAGPAMLAVSSSIDEPPPTRGWDAQATIEYSVREGRSAWAQWMRLGAKSYVVLVDGDAKAIAKRESQVAKLVDGVRPPELQEEVFATPVRALDRAKLDAFVDRAMRELDVPGAAIGVSVGGTLVYERVAGVRERGKPEPITLHTRFLMASVTKPMTTMMEAALVDRKAVRWDQPVTEILPTFAVGDEEITRQLQLWHMSCACTGMPRQDMEGLFEWDNVRPEARIALMRGMKPTTKIGETFQYSNPMLSAGGYIAAHAWFPEWSLDVAYSSAMNDLVFRPIGMDRTTIPTERSLTNIDDGTSPVPDTFVGDNAMPHALAIDGETRVMPRTIEGGVHPIAPAGGAWSTLPDMMKYAQTELGEGLAPNGTRVVSVENYRERTKPRIAVDEQNSYALGIDVGTYRGQRVLRHDGGSFGFGTRMWVMPEAKVAIVILTNVRNGNAKEQLPFIEAVNRKILEQLFDGAQPLAEKQLAYFVKLREREPYVPSKDRSWIARLVGRYHEPVLGAVEIRATENGAVFDAGEWKSAMDVVVGPDGTARTVMLDPPFAGAGVVVGPGDPPTLIVPDQTTYTFTRVR